MATTSGASKYVYTPLDELESKLNQVVNVYGVIKFFKPLQTCRGKDNYFLFMSITDSSFRFAKDKVKCQLFGDSRDSLPDPNLGDIIRIHRLKVQIYNNQLQCGSSPGTSYLLFSSDCNAPFTARSFSRNYSPVTEADKAKVTELRTWFSQYSDVILERDPDRAVPPAIKLGSKTLAEVHFGDFFNLLCQVVSIRECVGKSYSKSVLLEVWDGTEFNGPIVIEDRAEKHYLEEERTNEEMRKVPRNLVVDVLTFGEHAEDAGQLQPGDVIKICNLHATRCPREKLLPGDDPETVELCLHSGGSKFSRQIKIVDIAERAEWKRGVLHLLRRPSSGSRPALVNTERRDATSNADLIPTTSRSAVATSNITDGRDSRFGDDLVPATSKSAVLPSDVKTIRDATCDSDSTPVTLRSMVAPSIVTDRQVTAPSSVTNKQAASAGDDVVLTTSRSSVVLVNLTNGCDTASSDGTIPASPRPLRRSTAQSENSLLDISRSAVVVMDRCDGVLTDDLVPAMSRLASTASNNDSVPAKSGSATPATLTSMMPPPSVPTRRKAAFSACPLSITTSKTTLELPRLTNKRPLTLIGGDVRPTCSKTALVSFSLQKGRKTDASDVSPESKRRRTVRPQIIQVTTVTKNETARMSHINDVLSFTRPSKFHLNVAVVGVIPQLRDVCDQIVLACSKCYFLCGKNDLQPTSSGYTCPKCRKASGGKDVKNRMVVSYKLQFTLLDSTGSLKAQVYGEAADLFVGIPAADVLKDRSRVRQVMQRLKFLYQHRKVNIKMNCFLIAYRDQDTGTAKYQIVDTVLGSGASQRSHDTTPKQ